MEPSRITEADAEAIISALAKYTLPEQIGCLLSMIFSHVCGAVAHDMTKADLVMRQIIDAFPHQWEVTKGILQMEQMTPTSLH